MRIPMFAIAICGLLAGCQCCSWTERYCDKIDDINDGYPTCCDEHYHARWDLTRIGRPDWCRSRLSRLWCGDACDKCRHFHPPYVSQFEVHSHSAIPAMGTSGTETVTSEASEAYEPSSEAGMTAQPGMSGTVNGGANAADGMPIPPAPAIDPDP